MAFLLIGNIIFHNIRIIISFILGRQLLDKIAEPSNFSLQFRTLALIVVDFHLPASPVNKIDAPLVVPVDGKRGEIAEMKLDDVVAHSGNDLKIVDGDGFAEIYKFIVVSCSFAHLLHFEE